MRQVLNWRHFANAAEIERESLAALDSISTGRFWTVGALQVSLHPVTGAVL